MPPEEASRVGQIFGNIVASQQSFTSLENTNLHKDGHKVIIDTSGVPVFRPDGTFCGYRGIDRDVTERKLAVEALERSYAVLKGVVESPKEVVIFALDRQYGILRLTKITVIP